MNKALLEDTNLLKEKILEEELVKEYLKTREIVYSSAWFKKVIEENKNQKCNLLVKANITYEKMKKTGFVDPAFENLLTLKKEINDYLEEIKTYLDL